MTKRSADQMTSSADDNTSDFLKIDEEITAEIADLARDVHVKWEKIMDLHNKKNQNGSKYRKHVRNYDDNEDWPSFDDVFTVIAWLANTSAEDSLDQRKAAVAAAEFAAAASAEVVRKQKKAAAAAAATATITAAQV
jgi:hypothetical protein